MDARPDTAIRVAGASDAGAIAALRALWMVGEPHDPDLAARVAAWMADDGERRTTWLAECDGAAAGMASMLEYRRMPKPGRPDSRWGYIGNMFVREELRGRGIGSALLDTLIAAAEERDYARLVLSPSPRSIDLYRRAGFIVPDAVAGADRLLVRRRPSG